MKDNQKKSSCCDQYQQVTYQLNRLIEHWMADQVPVNVLIEAGLSTFLACLRVSAPSTDEYHLVLATALAKSSAEVQEYMKDNQE